MTSIGSSDSKFETMEALKHVKLDFDLGGNNENLLDNSDIVSYAPEGGSEDLEDENSIMNTNRSVTYGQSNKPKSMGLIEGTEADPNPEPAKLGVDVDFGI